LDGRGDAPRGRLKSTQRLFLWRRPLLLGLLLLLLLLALSAELGLTPTFSFIGCVCAFASFNAQV
jgi:hypothetical protein